MPALTVFAQWRRDIIAELHKRVYDDMLLYLQRFLRTSGHRLWCQQRPDNLAELMLLAACAHDMLAKSYNAIIEAFSGQIRLFPRAVQHNVRVVRSAMSQWAKSMISLGTRREWDRDARLRDLPEWMAAVRFWIDSSDIRIEKRGRRREGSSAEWSGKIGAPALRFMLLSDGRSRIRKMWGGYSPKEYDSNWVQIERQFFEDNLKGTGVVGDCHFFAAREFMRDPDLIAPPGDNVGIDLIRNRGFARNMAEAEKRKADVSCVRSTAEAPYSKIKRIFKMLDGGPYHAWREKMSELDKCFTWACGVVNMQIATEPEFV